jgi:hypothetical protein
MGLDSSRSEVLSLGHVLSPIAIVRRIEAMGDYNWFFAQAEVRLTEDVDHAEELPPLASIVSVVMPYPIHPLSLLLPATEGGEVEVVVRGD